MDLAGFRWVDMGSGGFGADFEGFGWLDLNLDGF